MGNNIPTTEDNPSKASGVGPQTGTVAYLSFVRPVNLDTANALLGACNQAVTNGATEIYILMSSEGGQLEPAFAIYNQLMGLPVTLTTHNIGSVNSVANVIFLAGNKRLAVPSATFLFHGTYWNFGQGGISRKQIAESLASLEADEKRMKYIIVSRTGLSRREINRLMNAGMTKDAIFAVQKGVIHDIADLSLPANVPIGQI